MLHPIWEWDGDALTGWILTSPMSVKAKHLDHEPRISLTYWDASQDVCTAECTTVWENDVASKHAGWERFVNGPSIVEGLPAAVWINPPEDKARTELELH